MSKSAFPDPADALSDPPGLIAVGGDLTERRLTDAYRPASFHGLRQVSLFCGGPLPLERSSKRQHSLRLGVCVNGFAVRHFEWS